MTGEEKESIEEKNRKIGEDNFYATILDKRGLRDLALVGSPSGAVVHKKKELVMLTTKEEGIAFLTKKYRNLIDCLNIGFPVKRICEQIDELSSLLDTDESFREYARVNFYVINCLWGPGDCGNGEGAFNKYLDLMSNESSSGLFVGSIVRPVFTSFKYNRSEWESIYLSKNSEGKDKEGYAAHFMYVQERDRVFSPGSIGEIIAFKWNRAVVKFEDCPDHKFEREWAPACFYWKDGKTNVGSYIHEELARIPLNYIDRKFLIEKIRMLKNKVNSQKALII